MENIVLKDLIEGSTVTTEEKEPDFVELGQEEKEELKSTIKEHSTDFTQLNNKKMDCLIRLVDENPQASRILLFIIQNMDGYNALVCSYKVFEERFGFVRSTIWRHIKYLKDNGYIAVQKIGLANAYTLTPDMIWKLYSEDKEYCKFPANVIISSSEQNE